MKSPTKFGVFYAIVINNIHSSSSSSVPASKLDRLRLCRCDASALTSVGVKPVAESARAIDPVFDDRFVRADFLILSRRRPVVSSSSSDSPALARCDGAVLR